MYATKIVWAITPYHNYLVMEIRDNSMDGGNGIWYIQDNIPEHHVHYRALVKRR